MPTIVKIKGDASEYRADLEAAKNQTITVFGKMQEGAKNFGTEINKAGIATRFLSASMGQNVVALGRAFQVFAAGKFAIMFAAITAAVVGLKKAWDELTLSAEEYNLKLDKSIETEQAKLDKMRETQTEEDGLMKRLKDLQEREQKTNEEQTEAARLTQILTDRYSDLGIEVNKATGEFADLETAMKRINEAQREERLDQLGTLIADKSLSNDALVKNKMKGGWLSRGVDWLNSRLGGTDVGKEAGKEFTGRSFEEQLQMANDILENSANTEEDIRFWLEIKQNLEDIIALQKQMDNLKKHDAETTAEEAKNMREKSEASRKELEQQQAAEKAAADAREREYEAWQKQQQEQAKAEQQAAEAEQKRLEAAQARRQSMVDDLRYSAMRAMGNSEQAAVEEALKAEMAARGVNGLSGEETMNITEIVKARLQLGSLMTSTAPMDYAPRVNSLIARGGSAQAVKLPSLEDIQKRTLNQLSEITKLVRYINEHVDGWGKVTNA